MDKVDRLLFKLRNLKNLKDIKTGKCPGCEHYITYGNDNRIFDENGDVIGYAIMCPRGLNSCVRPLEISEEMEAYGL